MPNPGQDRADTGAAGHDPPQVRDREIGQEVAKLAKACEREQLEGQDPGQAPGQAAQIFLRQHKIKTQKIGEEQTRRRQQGINRSNTGMTQ